LVQELRRDDQDVVFREVRDGNHLRGALERGLGVAAGPVDDQHCQLDLRIRLEWLTQIRGERRTGGLILEVYAAGRPVTRRMPQHRRIVLLNRRRWNLRYARC
jgi:hypothetical protein